MSVHYKFKSGKEAHTITFDSLHISVGELKKSIMQQRKIGKSADLDLQITNAQTKEVYESDSILIPKNTSLVVARVPVANAKKSWNKTNDFNKNDNSFANSEEKSIKNSNSGDGSEEDKIKDMLTQSTKDYDPSKYARGKGPIGPLPPNYTCYRCGKQGHYIKQCPTNVFDVKRSTGIPRSFMIPAKADQKGAMITASGEYAVPIIDHDAYKEIKKEKPPFFPVENVPETQKIEIPDDLKCSLCENLLQDAVLIPCCGNSFCDECIRLLLLESDNHKCPLCHEVDVSPDTLIPNRYLRLSVAKFKNETGFGNVAVSADEKSKEASNEETTEEGDLANVKSNSPIAGQEIVDSKNEHDNADKLKTCKEESKDVDLDEIFNKDELSNIDQENNSEDILEDASSTKIGIKNETNDSIAEKLNEKALSLEPIPIHNNYQLSVPNPVHTLQPPFALNYNGVNRYRTLRPRGGFSRVPGQIMVPRSTFSHNRPLLSHDSAFYNDPMQSYSQVGLSLPYGYGSQIRNPMFDSMYNLNSRGGQLNTLLPYPNNMNQMGTINGHAIPTLESDSSYYPPYKYDDYEDKLERFNRQLESRSRRYSRRSRSRSAHSKSRSRSYSSASSRSSSHSRKSHSRHHSSSKYVQRERSRSAHRYHKSSSSSYSRVRRSRSPSKYDKSRSTRERSDKDNKDYNKKLKSSRHEKDYIYKERMECVDKGNSRINRETYAEFSKEERIHVDIDENRVDCKKEEFIPNNISTSNFDSGTDKTRKELKIADKEAAVVDKEQPFEEFQKPLEQFKSDEKIKSTKKEEKVESKELKDKSSKDRHTKNKRNRSRSLSSSSDSSTDRESTRSKKKSKKSKDSSKSKHSEKHKSSKSKSKYDSKSNEMAKTSKSDKSSNKSKHGKSSKDEKSSKKSKEDAKSDKSKKVNLIDECVESSSDPQSNYSRGISSKRVVSEAVVGNSSENLDKCNSANKPDEIEIKIQEDYSDLENEEVAKCKNDNQKEIVGNHNKENLEESHESNIIESQNISEESHRKVKMNIKSVEKPLLSVTIENKAKIGSKISLKDDDSKIKNKDKESDKNKEKSKKSDKTKEKESKGSKDRHKDHSSHKDHKGDSYLSSSKSSKSKSKDKKKNDSHRSKRSHRKSKSRSVSQHKKIKSAIDTSSKYKSSKSHRK